MCLNELGYEVVLIGRYLPNSLPIPQQWPYRTKRMRLLFKSGPLFYICFNLRLFFYLLFRKTDVLLANDLDTLLPNFLVSKWRNIRLVYDSHEVFCEVPELQATPFKKKLWEKLEGFLVPRLKTAITVNESIKQYFEKKYGTPFQVVRNIPDLAVPLVQKTRADLKLPEDVSILILQGAGLNVNRGVEELIESMQFTHKVLLLIIGSGDVWSKLPTLIETFKVTEKVKLISKLQKSELTHYTQLANLGISIDKDTNLNYKWSLPNKVFDYIHAGIPILASRLTEIEKIIEQYNIGHFIELHEPKHIAQRIHESLNHADYKIWQANTLTAKLELNWHNEKQALLQCLREN